MSVATRRASRYRVALVLPGGEAVTSKAVVSRWAPRLPDAVTQREEGVATVAQERRR